MDAAGFARAQEPRELIGIAPVRLYPIARPPRHPRGTNDDALMTQSAQEPAKRKPARTGLVTELQCGVGMRGLELLDERCTCSCVPPMTPHRRTSVESEGAREMAMESLWTSSPT